jgi:hypothetical protein
MEKFSMAMDITFLNKTTLSAHVVGKSKSTT